MNIDRYTKSILTFIAIALMLNAFNPWIQPMDVEAYNSSLSGFANIAYALEEIASAIRTIR